MAETVRDLASIASKKNLINLSFGKGFLCFIGSTMMRLCSALLSLSLAWFLSSNLFADVVSSSDTGFSIRITKSVDADPSQAYSTVFRDFNKWWDAAHSVSGKAENLSIDLEKGCFLEKLPDGGFVRHLEIVRHIPGKQVRFSGGLGPLQGMAVHGALTIEFNRPENSNETMIVMTYNVTGYSAGGLGQIAVPVNRVLTEQMNRLEKLVNEQ